MKSPTDHVGINHATRRAPWLLVTGALLVVVGILAAVMVFGISKAPAPPATGPASRATQGATPSTSPVASATVKSSAYADFAALFNAVSSGVVRIRAVTCGGVGGGSGFLLSRGQVATAAHVVDGAVAVAVEVGNVTISGRVAGIDRSHDLALIQLDAQAPGHVLSLAVADPSPGTRVAAIGYPFGGALSITEGTVSGLHRVESFDQMGKVAGLLQTDTALNPGNSGGPMLTLDGRVVGIVTGGNPNASGISYAVEASTARPLLSTPGRLGRVATALCDRPLGPEDPAAADLPDDAVLADAVARTFAGYFTGINTGQYESAWLQLSPRLRSRIPLDEFSYEVSTSYDFGFLVRDATVTKSRAEVWLEFLSVQAPDLGPDGEGCTNWSLDYTLIPNELGGYWIDRASGHAGTNGHTPCS